MAKSIFKREKLLADLRAMQDDDIKTIIDMIENKQIGYTNPKKRVQVEQITIEFKFPKEKALRP
jgi:hypothetical protein